MAALGTVALTLPVQADNTIGTRWRTPGSKAPGSPVLAWGSLSVLAGLIANRTTGAGFSHNVRQYLSGTGAATAMIEVVYISGSTSANWTIVGDNLVHAGSVVGNGFFTLRATPVGGNPIVSQSTGWAWVAPAGDTAKPARVTGITINPGNGKLEFTWDASSDSAPPGVTPSGLKDYQLYKNGVLAATIPAPSPGIPFALTATQIGSYSPSPSFGYAPSNDGEWSVTSAGTGWHNTATEQQHFVGATLTGNGTMIVQVAQFNATGSYQYSTGGIQVRESRSQGAPLFSLYQEPSNVAPRVQCKVRATTGANAVNIAQTATLPLGSLMWLKVVRAGNTFTGYYSTDAVNWTLLVTREVLMAQAVEWGLAVASQSVGNAVTAIFRNVSITNAAQVAYTLNNVAGTALYTILARDNALNTTALSPAVSGTPLTAPPVTAMKFFPGHYAWLTTSYDNPTVRAGWVSFIAGIGGNAHVKGVVVTQFWRYLEKGVNGGDFSPAYEIIDFLLAELDKVSPKKKLIFQVSERGFGGYDKNLVLPQYIIDSGGFIQNDTGNWSGGLKCAAKLWNPTVMGRLIELYKAIGTRYNTHPLFAMMGAGESALDGREGDPEGWSAVGYFAQLQRLFTEAKPFFSQTPLRFAANFFGITFPQWFAFVDAIVNAWRPGGVVIGGPDPEFRPAVIGVTNPVQAQRSITVNELHRGNVRNAANNGWLQGGGHDYRNEIAWVGEQQEFGFEGVRAGYNETIPDIWAYQRDIMKARYMVWIVQTYTGNASQKWTGTTGIRSYLTSIGGAIGSVGLTKPTIGDWADPS